MYTTSSAVPTTPYQSIRDTLARDKMRVTGLDGDGMRYPVEHREERMRAAAKGRGAQVGVGVF